MRLLKRTKLVYGAGINDADYNVCTVAIIDGKRKIVAICPYYSKWKGVIERSHSAKFKLKNPTYDECSCVSDWIYFSKFKTWMETQDWEGKQLDKDILVEGNKIYGPDTCVFVDQRVNNFLIDSKAARGQFPIGVMFDKKKPKYVARCCSVETGKQEHLGRYKTPEEAYEVWLAFKLEQAYILAAEQSDERVAKALIDRYENYKPN